MIHADPVVDVAMRANIGKGFHFFDPGTLKFFRSSFSTGVMSRCGRFAFLVERRKAHDMGGVRVQFAHSRVVRVELATGETENLTQEGKVLSEYVQGKYVSNGDACKYDDNATARIFAAKFASEVES
jgi:hypothetical protein